MNYTGTIAETAYNARKPGGHWFEPGTMRFFRSRIGAEVELPAAEGVRPVVLFITSEQGPDRVRGYTLRAMDCDGNIFNATEFQGLTRGQTRAAVKNVIKDAHETGRVELHRERWQSRRWIQVSNAVAYEDDNGTPRSITC